MVYVPDCPNLVLARGRLGTALAGAGLTGAVVREREVISSDDAARLGMRGSRTILVDGRDPFADADEPPSLSCRLCDGDTGVSGAPAVEQLVAALGRIAAA